MNLGIDLIQIMKERENPMDSLVEKATEKDLDVIQGLMRYGVKEGGVIPTEPYEILSHINEYYLIRIQEEIAGMVRLQIHNDRLAEVRSLVVVPEWQNSGTGSLLIDHCIKEAEKKNIRWLIAITDRTALFQRRGFSDKEAMLLKINPRNA